MNQKIKMFFPVIIYMAVCLLTLAWFWLGVSGSDMLGFVFVEFYLIIPISNPASELMNPGNIAYTLGT